MIKNFEIFLKIITIDLIIIQKVLFAKKHKNRLNKFHFYIKNR